MSGREIAPSSISWTCASRQQLGGAARGLEEPRVAADLEDPQAVAERACVLERLVLDPRPHPGRAGLLRAGSALTCDALAHALVVEVAGSRSRSWCAARRGSRCPSSRAAPPAPSPSRQPVGALDRRPADRVAGHAHDRAHEVRALGPDSHRAVGAVAHGHDHRRRDRRPPRSGRPGPRRRSRCRRDPARVDSPMPAGRR